MSVSLLLPSFPVTRFAYCKTLWRDGLEPSLLPPCHATMFHFNHCPVGDRRSFSRYIWSSLVLKGSPPCLLSKYSEKNSFSNTVQFSGIYIIVSSARTTQILSTHFQSFREIRKSGFVRPWPRSLTRNQSYCPISIF